MTTPHYHTHHNRIWSLLGSFLLIILIGVAQGGCARATQPSTAPSSPQSGQQSQQSTAIDVVFTTPSLVYPDKAENRTPPPIERELIADIDAAKQSVEVVAFEYNLPALADALLRAKKRGLTVRLALDREQLEDPEDAEWAGRMEDANIPISWQDTTAFLHSKFAIIDRAVVWTGSWNMTINGTYRNNNNILRITIPDIIENYVAEFEQMMQGNFGNSKRSLTPNPVVQYNGMTVENYFSPKDGVADHVVERVQDAQKSIKFLTFSYTSDPIGKAMIERHDAGVTVQGVFEKRNARGIGSEYERLQEEGMDVHRDGNCYTMHHKVIIIDDETVITGSYNYTQRAEDTNDENLLIIDDRALASRYLEEFNRVYQQAKNPTQCGR